LCTHSSALGVALSQQYCGCRRHAEWHAIFALNQRISLHGRHLTRLITLGQLALIDLSGNGQSLLGHKRKLVLLSVLALADGPVSRDVLMEMFWAEDKDQRARRHSLSNALSFLRGILGPGAITTYRAEVLLVPGRLDVDAVDLLAAARARNFAHVIDLYRGSFLDGVSVSGSPSFDIWAAGLRDTIRHTTSRAAAVLCLASANRREWDTCATAAKKWLEVEPDAPEPALHLLNSVRAAGTPAARLAALTEYDRIVDRLARDHGRAPDPQVTELAHRIQAKAASERVIRAGNEQGETQAETPKPVISAKVAQASLVPAIDSASAEARDLASAAVSGSASGNPAPGHSSRVRRRIVISAAGAIALVIVGIAAWTWLPTRSAITRPVIAITDIASTTGDTASIWLQRGLQQMLATDIARSSDVDVIEPSHLRDVRTSGNIPAAGTISESRAIDLAHRVGATLLVRGNFTPGAGTYTLGLTVRDLRTGAVVSSFNVVASDPISLSDRAASKLLEAMTANSDVRARFADVETSSSAAYQHFIRSEQAHAEGRFAEGARELDAAIALDSGFGSALLARLDIAIPAGDSATMARLRGVIARARFTEWDLLAQTLDSAMHNGERARAERLGRLLVARYPHDPRAYEALGNLYALHGNVPQARSIFRRELALDSLGDDAARGPCVPCTAYHDLAWLDLLWGQLPEAEWTARRWLRLQPDLPAAWSTLAAALAFSGKYSSAIDAQHRAESLSGTDSVYTGAVARLLIEARRFDDADSLIRTSMHEDNARGAPHNEAELDALALLQRERGELRASIQTLGAIHNTTSLFERIDALGRLGDYTAAARLFDTDIRRLDVASQLRPLPSVPLSHGFLAGDKARAFCWGRALKAAAMAGGGDTLQLRALSDSIRDVSVRSYYGRDWRLHHHVLGRIAMLGKRYTEAEREFTAAQWEVSGWTANLAWLARAELAQNHPRDAVTTLRRAYQGGIDGMGRYEPRSELDYLMAISFRAAGQPDSAAVYAAYTRTAWSHADPEVHRLLAALP